MIDLTGRRALVTGGGRGIGKAIALALAKAGADVAVCSRSDHEISAVAAEICALGRHGTAITCDVMDRGQIAHCVEETVSRLGGLDILVNNAGGVSAKRLEDLDHVYHDGETFEQNLFLNLTQVFYFIKFALPHMIRNRWGRIINIGSGYAKNGNGPLAYSAAKHGLVGLTRSLAYPVAEHGINVNVLCPGWTNTRLVQWPVVAAFWKTDPESARRMAENQNIQRRIVEPEELGPMAVLLASDAAKAITGQVISVDGGFMV